MTTSDLEFLCNSSASSVTNYQLARLNQAANIRRKLNKVLEQLVDELVELEAEARTAGYVRQYGEQVKEQSRRVLEGALPKGNENVFDV